MLWLLSHLSSGPEIPDVAIETGNMSFAVGEEVNLQCSIKGIGSFASAKWIRDETKQTLEIANFSNDENSESSFHLFSHEINKVSTDDAGYYTCIVNFDGNGSQNASYKLRVRGKWFLSLVSYSVRLSVF